jgi:hypothetical protein
MPADPLPVHAGDHRQDSGPVLVGPVVAQVLAEVLAGQEEGDQGQETVEAPAGAYNDPLLQPAGEQARLPQ